MSLLFEQKNCSLKVKSDESKAISANDVFTDLEKIYAKYFYLSVLYAPSEKVIIISEESASCNFYVIESEWLNISLVFLNFTHERRRNEI